MPVRPPPLEIRCPRCGWEIVWQPASDALTGADLPSEVCARCGHAELQARPAGVAAAFWQRFRQWLGAR